MNRNRYYLVSWVSSKDEQTFYAGGVEPLKSKEPKTLSEIHDHMVKWYSGEGVLHLTNVQKISEQDFEEYGGHYEIELNITLRNAISICTMSSCISDK